MEDLCFLDSAVCNSKLRTGFLETLKVCYCTNMMKGADKSFNWVMLRGLRVKKFDLFCVIPSRVESILVSRHLQLLGVFLHNVELLVKHFNVDTIVLQVNLEQNFDSLLLKKYGHRLTRVTLDSNADYSTIAACCPNLKEFSAPENSFILPIVDACELDVINNCHLGSLVQRQKCVWTYYCDLVRTTVVDETAVCLGEGKYYHMTNLQCIGNMTDEDVEFLTPLMTHLKEIFFSGKELKTVAVAAVGRCYKLNKIKVLYYWNCSSELRLLLQQSSKLLHLILTSDWRFSVDACFDVVPYSCPLLESCMIYDCAVQSADIMSALFTRCSCLTEVTVSRWPYAASVEGVEYLSVGYARNSRRYGRRLRNMRIESARQDVLMEILSKNPNLRSIELSRYHVSSELMESLVMSCPHLTNVTIYGSVYGMGHEYLASSVVSPLGQCRHLDTLFLTRISGSSTHSLSALLDNKQNLRSLTLADCNISLDMGVIIGDYCPALTYLNLFRNERIQSGDIIALLQRCCKLEQLNLSSCADIGPEILSSIKSPPMKHLSVGDTRITSEDMKDFSAVDGFRCDLVLSE